MNHAFVQREAERRRISALARRVSAALNRAGVPKASRYKTWGRDHEGFIAHSGHTDVAVLFSNRKIAVEWQDRVRDVLTDAGFEIAFERPLNRAFDHGGFDIALPFESQEADQ